MDNQEKSNLRPILLGLLIVFALIFMFSCNVYQYASDDNMKYVSCEGTGYYATDETKDSLYIEVLDKWVAKEDCVIKN